MSSRTVVPTANTDRLTAPALLRETHTGMVILVGDRAYKVKKPVITDFLDFSTPERREVACAREVSLNRRLAPDSYLGVAHFDNLGHGAPEPVIVMLRYPDSQRLSTMAVAGEPMNEHIARIAERLARFHEQAYRSSEVDACATAPAIAKRWEQNLIELRRHVGTALSSDTLFEIDRLAMQYISGRRVLFAGRIALHRIVDGHGDLLTDDIFCLPDKPILLDCLEFDDQLRYVDCVDDAAFLAMDLEFIGHKDLADDFASQYRRLSGDAAPTSLWHFYIAYRAVVRAKVECIRFDQGVDAAAGNAQRHLDLALRHLRVGAVGLVLVGGGPGTGKSTVARELARRIDADIISTDDVRRELYESGNIDGASGQLNGGLYSPERVHAVYNAVLLRASVALAHGRSVVLDGTWRDPENRRRARAIASQHCSPAVELVCTTALPEAVHRIITRRHGSSDATPEVAKALAGDGTQWVGMLPVDTSTTISASVENAYQAYCCAI